MGVVSVLDVPGAKALAAYTRQVMSNNRAQAVPVNRRDISPIRHVFYIIKENRTYDQVFGDLPQGNGDPSLAQFGREVTPNQHALAEKYVLLDNYYTPGDQSALGHRWCTQGYASDWLHKYGNGRNDQNPMLFAPNDFLWDSAKAHGLSVRSYG
jgi:phospholipase C